MKYCKKCGMLLEDNMELCIGCGSDVKSPDNYTLYPEEIQARIEVEKKEAGKRNLAVVAIVLIFVVILLMIGIFASRIIMIDSSNLTDGIDVNEAALTEAEDKDSDISGLFGKKDTEVGLESSGDVDKPHREVKDDEGLYCKYITVKDDAGHDIFKSVYPEELSEITESVDYSWGSQVYPAVFSFAATNEDNNTQLTYRSVQHYQYITGKAQNTFDIEKNVGGCISFYDFKSVDEYLKEMIKQAYPGAKKIEALNDEDVKAGINDKFNKIISEYEKNAEKELPVIFGLSEGTTFTHKDTYKSLKIKNYRILVNDDHAVNCKFYVPVFCEKYEFKDNENGFDGQLSDCYILALVSFEAGSDELYDWYEDAFDIFINNSHIMDDFYISEQAYIDNIRTDIKNGRTPKVIKGSEVSGLYDNTVSSLNDFYDSVKTFLADPPSSDSVFVKDEYRISSDVAKQIFLDPDRELIFTTTEMSEYPGDEFLELIKE
ncbi:MAG: hypothetical protein K6E98_04735 [Lachnospiraceae bacterium]|nr:hypothetical protein [Lachnospiraceae bacterium]